MTQQREGGFGAYGRRRGQDQGDLAALSRALFMIGVNQPRYVTAALPETASLPDHAPGTG